MSTNQYTNLTILDCNRQHSIQARSGNEENPALFTNELGRGITLNVGDKVSVQSVYVSEIGADSDTVEFKGDKDGTRRTIYYTKETTDYPTTLEDQYTNGSDALPLITGFQEVTLEHNASLTYDITDNETYITIQYYLNNSGDSGYISLPRRFGCEIFPTDETNWNASNWTENDDIEQYGRPYHEVQDNQFVSSDYIYYDQSTDATDTGIYKLTNDCSRFTLMKRSGTTKLRRQTVKFDGTHIDNAYPPTITEINSLNYYIYKEPIKITVDKGFNSPDTISEVISEQLKEASEPIDFTINYQGVPRTLTQYYRTKTFNPQICGSYDTFNTEVWLNFDSLRDNTPESKENAWKYWSNLYNIYEKRPEIRETGQVCNNYLGNNHGNAETLVVGNRQTDTLITYIEWTGVNLQRLNELFKAQRLYPELLSNDNAQKIQPPYNNIQMSVENARYLHMNTQYSSTRLTQLGGDNIQSSASGTNNRSLPLFFYYQSENVDKFTDGHDINDLCYGFATKNYHHGKDYIELHPELIGGINLALYESSPNSASYTNIEHSSLLGYDHSFNAYGSAVLMGYSGRLISDYALANVWGVADRNTWKLEDHAGRNASYLRTAGLMRYNYVGCNNPKFEYDTQSNRFFFSDLHTPEVAGQDWISAGDSGSGVSPSIADNTETGGQIVYKINKRINPYTYTPDMKPYEYTFQVEYNYGAGGSSTISRDISAHNRNIQPWSIFDSQCGIYISDFGYDESQWVNGLWGVLGFSYEQFNNTLNSSNNRNSRVVNGNINTLNIPTTNSDIVSTDTRDYIVNQFGAVYFTTQLPTTSTLVHEPVFPAITQNTESIKLLAQNLPRKMLRPYYCIRSDIIDEAHYVGGKTSNNTLPVVAICDKQYSGGDFYFSSESTFEFTITKKKTITNITTSIHDPNQSFANVDKDSAVIYKIQSNVINDTSVAQELLEEMKKRGSRI